MHSPRLVFLDEPSTGLDPQSRSNLWDHVRALRDELGSTVFLTTHYLDEADALCDRVMVIDHGKIVAEGMPDELKHRVSGDVVTLSFGTPASGQAELVLADHPDVKDITADGASLRLSVNPASRPCRRCCASWTARASPWSRSSWPGPPWTTCSSP